MADLDDFRKINDEFGRKTGDEALQTTVDLLRQGLRKDDLIARVGGDDFFILLEIDNEIALNNAVQRLNRKFADYNAKSGLPYRLDPTICGLVYDPAGGLNAEQFLMKVESLVRQEKSTAAGGNFKLAAFAGEQP
jgi:diguanylate cyclase (GGDEF)-like protein